VVQRVDDDEHAPGHQQQVRDVRDGADLPAQRDAVDQRRHHEAQEGVRQASHGGQHVPEVGRAQGHRHVQQHQAGAQGVLGEVFYEGALRLQCARVCRQRENSVSQSASYQAPL
jgi:ABC-type nickel/cobalt efflux system permease component RcnA